MKKDLCELIIIIDESGSMGNVKNDTIGGFNEFLKTHQEMPGEAKLTLVKFDNTYTIVNNGIDIQSVSKLTDRTYMPGGTTALLDAVGKTIDDVGRRLDITSEDEKPEKVMVMIITDGEENASKEYNLEQLKAKIKEQQDVWKWEFVFLGADQDAWNNASSMGMYNAVNFTQANMGNTLKKMSHSSSGYRTRGVVDMNSYSMTEEEIDKDLQVMKDMAQNKTDTDTQTT